MFNREAYIKLLTSITPKKIESEEQYDEYLLLVEPLLFSSNRTPEDEMIGQLIALLIEEYEAKHYPIPKPQPLDLLLHLIEAKGLKQKDLANIIGDKNITKLLLNNMLEIDKPMAKVLGEYFNVNYKDFL